MNSVGESIVRRQSGSTIRYLPYLSNGFFIKYAEQTIVFNLFVFNLFEDNLTHQSIEYSNQLCFLTVDSFSQEKVYSAKIWKL